MNIIISLGFFIFAFLLVISFSLLLSSIFRISNLPVFLLSLYLLSFANIVLVSEIAGIMNLLNNRLFFLVIHFILAALTYSLWRRRGQPEIFNQFKILFSQLKRKKIISSFKKWPQIWVLAIAVIGFYLFSAFLILKVPPNNFDSMTSHMPRVIYWLQHGNFWPWPTWNITQTIYPINAQVQILWTVLFWGNDQFAGFPQWMAALAGIIAVYGLARVIGWKKPQSIFAALIWALLPEILLESTTTQNHLVAGSLFAIALYLLFFGIKSNKKEVLILSGFSIAMALGTHQAIFFTLPGLFAASLILWIRYKKRGFKLLLFWGTTALVLFLIFGSFMYIVNLFRFGNPFQPSNNSFISGSVNTTSGNQPLSSSKYSRLVLLKSPNDPIFLIKQYNNLDSKPKMKLSDMTGVFRILPIIGDSTFIKYLLINTFRYFYASFDLTGLPDSVSSRIYDLRTKVTTKFMNILKIPINGNVFDLAWRPASISEDTAWFGLIGFFVLIPLFFKQVIIGVKIRDPLRLGIISIFLLYVFVWAGFIIGGGIWSVWQGRHFILISAILSPFIASLSLSKGFYRGLSWILVLISIFQAGYITINNRSKPLIGSYSIWGLDWYQKTMLNAPQYEIMSDAVESIVPKDATLGLMLAGVTPYEYPLFGEIFTRKLIQIYPNEQILKYDWLIKHNITWLLLCDPNGFPQNFILIDSFKIDYYSRICYLLSK